MAEKNVSQTARDKLKEIREKVHAAYAQLFVMQQALTHGDTDLELLSSDLLAKQCEVLSDCEMEVHKLASPSPSAPRPPGKRRTTPAALRVVNTEAAA